MDNIQIHSYKNSGGIIPEEVSILFVKEPLFFSLSGKKLSSLVFTKSTKTHLSKYQILQEAVLLNEKDRFSKYYLPCHKGLTMFCLGMLKDIELAENAASDTLMKFWHYPNIAEIKDIRSWLFVAAKHICINYLSKTARRREIDQTLNLPKKQSATAEQQMIAAGINEIIKQTLNEKEYAIWQLYQKGFDNKEISAQLHSSEKTIANLKTIARKKLQQRLKSYRL